jgi:hypothetical protein
MTKLTGADLLNFRAESLAQGMTAGQIARGAGYAEMRENGTERIYFTEFYENILIARGHMYRITIHMAENTSMGVQPIWCDSFTTSSRSARSIARKVRELTKLTNVKCKKVIQDGKVYLYPYRSGEMVAYNLPG